MKVTRFKVEGPLLIEPQVYGDERGFFVERFRKDQFKELGLPDFIQDNYSRSAPKIVRGLHYQYSPVQGKLVTATHGEIFDVAVDIRHKSPTFGQSVCARLSGNRPAWLWVPPGFAHGFQVLGELCADVMYKVDALYTPESEGGIHWLDPNLEITWPKKMGNLSKRDTELPGWDVYLKDPRF